MPSKQRTWSRTWLPLVALGAVVTWFVLAFAMHETLHKEEDFSASSLIDLGRKSDTQKDSPGLRNTNAKAISREQELKVLDREIAELKKRTAQHDLAAQLAKERWPPGGGGGDSVAGGSKSQTTSRAAAGTTSDPLASSFSPPQHVSQPSLESSSSTALLLEGWQEYHDAGSGRPYFHNAVTGETRWERPTVAPIQGSQVAGSGGLASVLASAASALPSSALIEKTTPGGGSAGAAPATASSPPPATSFAVSSVLPSGCEVLDGIDFAPARGAAEKAVEGLTLEGCCERCRDTRLSGDGGCEVAVFSSASDTPPNACWVKSRVDRDAPVRTKRGVKALCPKPGVLAALTQNTPPASAGGATSSSSSSSSSSPGRRGGSADASQAGRRRGEGSSTDARYAAWAKELGLSHLMTLPPPPSSSSSSSSSSMSTKPREENIKVAAAAAAAAAGGVGGDSGSGESSSSDVRGYEEVLSLRAAAVKGAMKHAWSNYREHAWGADNLSPISGRGSGGGFNHAVTMVDSLDTLWLMGMKDEFQDALKWMKQNLPQRLSRIGGGTSLFETTIRTLGGLLAAHDLSKDPFLLKVAKQLGDQVSSRTSSEGVTPYMFGGGSGGMGCPSLAESGTTQVEMNYLSQVTGNPKYAKKANAFYDTVSQRPSLDGLWPNCWQHGRGRITFGADGDSFYEYLVKGWLQGGKQDDRLWRMYNAAVDGMEKWLVAVAPDGLTYLNNVNMRSATSGGSSDPAMEHLTCFVPGWLALGIPHQADPTRAARHLDLAEQLAYTCWQMYERQPTGIGPERVKGLAIDLSKTDTKEYILRPEAVEGWWYMYELTGKDQYRAWGWNTFLAFEKHLKVAHGYASLQNVRSERPAKMDRMESFFLAETLKYLYLLQDPTRPIRLDTHVFNTEAHPFSIPA